MTIIFIINKYQFYKYITEKYGILLIVLILGVTLIILKKSLF